MPRIHGYRRRPEREFLARVGGDHSRMRRARAARAHDAGAGTPGAQPRKVSCKAAVHGAVLCAPANVTTSTAPASTPRSYRRSGCRSPPRRGRLRSSPEGPRASRPCRSPRRTRRRRRSGFPVTPEYARTAPRAYAYGTCGRRRVHVRSAGDEVGDPRHRGRLRRPPLPRIVVDDAGDTLWMSAAGRTGVDAHDAGTPTEPFPEPAGDDSGIPSPSMSPEIATLSPRNENTGAPARRRMVEPVAPE